MKSALNKAS